VRPLFAGSLKPPDRDIEIVHGAKLSLRPLQFGPDSLPLGSATIGEKNRYSRAQASKSNPHLMQRFGIAYARSGMICGQIRKTAARQHAKGCVACHHRI
jgi:hypothetical protein